MSDEEKKLGIDELRDVLVLGENVAEDLEKHKADDGKIDTMEITQTTLSNVPEVIRAWAGKDQIDDEIKDLDSDEAMEVATRATAVVQKLLKVFFSKA